MFLGWLGFGGLIFTVSHLVYTNISPGDNVSVPSPAAIPPFQGTALVAAKPPRLLEGASDIQSQPSQPKTAGSDQEAVEFVNRCREFIFNDTSVRKDLVNSWLEKLNEFTMKSAVDVSAGVIFQSTSKSKCVFTYSIFTRMGC